MCVFLLLCWRKWEILSLSLQEWKLSLYWQTTQQQVPCCLTPFEHCPTMHHTCVGRQPAVSTCWEPSCLFAIPPHLQKLLSPPSWEYTHSYFMQSPSVGPYGAEGAAGVGALGRCILHLSNSFQLPQILGNQIQAGQLPWHPDSREGRPWPWSAHTSRAHKHILRAGRAAVWINISVAVN